MANMAGPLFSSGAASSTALTMRRNRERVIDTMAQQRLRWNEVSDAETHVVDLQRYLQSYYQELFRLKFRKTSQHFLGVEVGTKHVRTHRSEDHNEKIDHSHEQKYLFSTKQIGTLTWKIVGGLPGRT